MAADGTISARPAAAAWVPAFRRSFSQNRGAVLGLAVLLLLAGSAICAPLIAPYSPSTQFRDALLLPPAWVGGGRGAFLLGTDAVGRDIFSRLVYGARLSLLIGLVVVSIALAAGIVIGLVAGFFRGWIETLIMRCMDVLLAFPSLLLALVVVAVLGPGLINATVAIAIVLQPHFVRLTRAAVINERTKEYVAAAQAVGAGLPRLMFVTVLPNCMPALIVQAALCFSTAILDAAALGFLGMGAQPPTPEWGTMLADAREFVLSAWWVVTFPGLAILLTVLSVNLIGDGLRDTLDPRVKSSL